MELGWSTFLLEIINFLVLVWILHRFLYRPVLDIIAERHRQIEGSLVRARRETEEGEGLKRQYANRLTDWEREREARRKVLDREIEAERGRRRAELDAELETERRKWQVVQERERAQHDRQVEARALELAGKFAARLLTRVAGPEVERKLVEAAVEDLRELGHGELEELRRVWQAEGGAIDITSAGGLDEVQRRAIEDGLSKLVQQPVACRYHRDPSLLGGLRVRVGAWMLQANLEDELKSFVDAAR